MKDIIKRLAPEPVQPDPHWKASTLRQIRSSAGPRRRRVRFLVVGATVGVALGGGAAVANVGPFSSSSQSDKNTDVPFRSNGQSVNAKGARGPLVDSRIEDQEAVTEKPWATNQFGLTVGAPTRGDVEAHNLPDLMPTFLDSAPRLEGFYRSDEFYVYGADGELENGPDKHNVYGPDGRTLLGKR